VVSKQKKKKKVFRRYIIIAGIFLIALLVLKISLKPAVCANSVSCVKDLSGTFDPKAENGIYLGKAVEPPSFVADHPVFRQVLGEASDVTKRIEVDLSTQTLYAYQNDELVMSFPISTGKWTPTPTGTFHIWIKLRYTRMSGGEGADYYDLPNVPYTMFYYNDQVSQGQGFSLHGAYWHNNFGHAMSHGCVNIAPVNAGKLYDWAGPVAQGNTTYASDSNPGTEVVIYGKAP
jgi:hypothetical protein